MNKPTITEVLPMIKAYYGKHGNSVGGSLHITLEDGNIDNNSVMDCLELAKQKNDTDGIIIAETLLKMSKTQRKKLSIIDKGII
jgi:hypothetical protein